MFNLCYMYVIVMLKLSDDKFLKNKHLDIFITIAT